MTAEKVVMQDQSPAAPSCERTDTRPAGTTPLVTKGQCPDSSDTKPTDHNLTVAQETSDAGLSLIEVLVAMTVFAMVAASASLALIQVHSGVRDNERRVQASGIAQSQIEAARAQAATGLTDGLVTYTKTVAGIDYTISQQTNYVATGQTQDQCKASTSTLAYKSVDVTVTWNDMGAVQPVKSSTAIALKPGEFESKSQTGGFVLRVLGSTGAGIAGVQVTATADGTPPRIKVTDTAGCVAFANLPAASEGTEYSVSFAGTNITGPDGSGLPERVILVTRNEIKQVAPTQVGVQSNGQITIENERPVPTPRAHWYRSSNGGQWAVLPACTATTQTVCMFGDLNPPSPGITKTGIVRNLPVGRYEVGTSACTTVAPTVSVAAEVTSGGNSTVTLPVAAVEVTILRDDKQFETQEKVIVFKHTSCPQGNPADPGGWQGPSKPGGMAGYFLPPGEYTVYSGSSQFGKIIRESNIVTVEVTNIKGPTTVPLTPRDD